MSYKDDLQRPEWEAKRYEILQRDNYRCQDCGITGVNQGIFYPITSISDVDKLLPNLLLDGKDLQTFCEEIQNMNWENRKLQSAAILYNNPTIINRHLYKYIVDWYQMTDYPTSFITTNPIIKLNFKNIVPQLLSEVYLNNIKFNSECKSRYHAYLINEDLGKGNYVSINYSIREAKNYDSRTEILSLTIIYNNILFEFTFYHISKKSDNNILQITPLNIHHKYYILGRKPWEYDNDALITLCPHCHQKRHLQTKIPLFELNNHQLRQIKDNLQICDRCGGAGYLPQYHYYLGGICFKCHGEGIYGYE